MGGDDAIHLFSNPCPAGQVQDYDPATRQFLPGCVDDTPGYRAFGFPTGPAPQQAQPDLSVWWWALAGVVVLAVIFGGKR